MTEPARDEATDRRPGRPRDARVDAAIMDAAINVLAERGPGGFSVDEVAARAGCGKATVYRRWRSRSALLLETAHRMGLEPPLVDTGSLRGDLVELLLALATKMRDTAAGRILPGVVAEAAVSPEMRNVLRSFTDDRRERPRAIVRRGIARGELPADADVELLLDLTGGPVLYRELIAQNPVDAAFVARLVDAVLPGFGWTGGPTDKPATTPDLQVSD
jgi:AcrR family transcriptional regulator